MQRAGIISHSDLRLVGHLYLSYSGPVCIQTIVPLLKLVANLEK